MLCKGVEFMITLFDYKLAVIDTIYPPFNEVNKKSVQKHLKESLMMLECQATRATFLDFFMKPIIYNRCLKS